MIHKIHAGGELASIPGADGKVWDDPATTTDESADNGEYAIWGNKNRKHTWWKVGFPAIIENCTKCHQAQADVDNWKNKPSRGVRRVPRHRRLRCGHEPRRRRSDHR
jgi:hypothetical protein